MRESVQSARDRAASGGTAKPTMAAVLDFYGVDRKEHVAGWQSIKCPFHSEDTPSCRVNVDEGGFLCLSCGAQGGDSFQFIMLRDSLTFPEAKALAETIPGERAGASKPGGRKSVTVRGSGYKPRYRRK